MSVLKSLGIAVLIGSLATVAFAEDSSASDIAEVLGQDNADASQGPLMTKSEMDRIQMAVTRCWQIDTGPDAVTVVLGVSMNPDGTPVTGSVRLISAEGGTEAGQQMAFEKAKRAVLFCGKGGYPLPPEKYEQWKNIEMVFDPKSMR